MGETLRVVKLGGSLLDLPDLRERFWAWQASQPLRPTLLVVGGGKLVESLRRYDAVHRLPAHQSHWLAILAMGATAHFAATLLAIEQFIASEREARDFVTSPPALAICDVYAFLQEVDPVSAALPLGWHATSDSIAAYLARHLKAEELVLLKSVSVDAHATLKHLAAAGYVDEHFPFIAHELHWRWVNLRSPDSQS